MRTKKRGNVPNPVARGFPPAYEPAFKRVVVLYAEQKSNQEARRRYGISEETIKRWRRLRDEIMEQTQHTTRRSQRLGHDSCSESTSSRCDSDINALKETQLDLDSMPLQQRLSQNFNEMSSTMQSSDSPLHSLALSPTKLKVTRQGRAAGSLATAAELSPVCLKWDSHHANMQTAFPSLLTKEQYVDTTLVSEGQMLKCHKIILSSCSPYFEEVLNSISPFQHPVLFMKDIPFWALKAICDFMYSGEVHIPHEKLQDLLAAASTLKIKGLGNSIEENERKQLVVPEMKQEIASPSTVSEEPLKQVKSEKVSLAVKPAKNEGTKERVSRRPRSLPIQKDREPLLEEYPAAAEPNSVAESARPNLRNVTDRASKRSKSRLTYTRRKSNSLRKNNRSLKTQNAALELANKVKEPPMLTKANINDPLDLLQPVYEEVAKEAPKTNAQLAKLRERGGKKVRKRKLVDYVEEREESPPLVFLTRKGTRSRPNVKIPKIFDSHYEATLKEAADATIVREPHTDQNDPLIGVEVEEIKAEPLDVEESALEVEENMVNYIVHDDALECQEVEEIIGNFDSPLVNRRRRNTANAFKKHQPLIVDVHTVSESDVRMMGIKKENVEIVDIAKISNVPRAEVETTSQIVISNVQSMADIPGESDKESGVRTAAATRESSSEVKDSDDPLILRSEDPLLTEAASSEEAAESDHLQDSKKRASETDEAPSIQAEEPSLPTEDKPVDGLSNGPVAELQEEPEQIMENGLEVTQPQLGAEDGPTSPSTVTQPTLTGDNIEAELEQCLASTSSLIKSTVTAQKLVFFEDEDFTKDVEFEDLSCPKPTTWSSFKEEATKIEAALLVDREAGAIGAASTVDFSEVVQFSAGQSPDDEAKLEDSLLADLEDEMAMKEGSNRASDDPEKTLEMIVQDLSDSLYEMEK